MTILKGIPRVITPELLAILARMGHGDELVLADANFPAASVAASTPTRTEVRLDGASIPELLEAIMQLLPLDETAPPAILMGMVHRREREDEGD
jgi:L-fucose mutarotase